MGLGDSLRPADGGGWIPLLYGPLGCGGDAVRSGGAVPDDPGRGFHRVWVSVRTVLDVKLNNKNPRSHRLRPWIFYGVFSGGGIRARSS